MNRRVLLAAALLIAFGPGLWPGPSRVHGPPRGADRIDPPTPPASVLLATVTLPWDVLREGLQERVPEVFVDVEGQPTGRGALLDLSARRAGPVTIAPDDEAMRLEIPIDIAARLVSERARTRRADRGRPPPAGTRVDASLTMIVHITYSLGDDWSLEPTTTVSHRWRDRPTLSLGPLRIGLRKIADKALAKSFAQVGDDIDQRMREDDKLPQQMREAWEALHAPRRLDEQGTSWLVSTPADLYASAPAPAEDGIELAVGVGGRFALVVGESPAPVTPPPLPPPQAPPEDGRFTLALPATMSWTALSAQTDAALARAELPDGLRVTGAELYPSGAAVVLGLDVDAGLGGFGTGGRVYFQARPVLDPRSEEVRLADFDYALDTGDRMLSTANAAAQQRIRDAVAPQLVYDYGQPLADARAQAEQQLRDRPDLDGQLDALAVQDVAVTDAGLTVLALASGRLQVILDELRDPPERERAPPKRTLAKPRR